ncbi:hypothetical protein [Deinococcus sonorensis]|uniref:M-like protein n=2 Tax=Deinococcus sonorensis TaxID=309891 RepID=A0AAU7U547_9DEIO
MTDNTDPNAPAQTSNALPDADVSENGPIYQPPKQAEEADIVDATVDGTSASHYGANDPALYEDQGEPSDQQD